MEPQMVNKYRYSIFIPCYNCQDTIIELLKSVTASVLENDDIIPILIVNDASSDNSEYIILDYIKNFNFFMYFLNKVNVGERETTNNAIKYLENDSDFVFIIHADDTVEKTWIRVMIDTIEKMADSKVFSVWSGYRVIDKNKIIVHGGDDRGQLFLLNSTSVHKTKELILKFSTNWHISGAAINIKCFNEVGGFDKALAQYGDAEFCNRCLLNEFSHIYIARTLTNYRISPNSVTEVSFKTGRDIIEMMYIYKKFSYLMDKSDRYRLMYRLYKIKTRRLIKYLLKLNLSRVRNLLAIKINI